MLFFGLCRLRRRQRLTKTFTVILSATLISYFVFSSSKLRQRAAATPSTASVVVDSTPSVVSKSSRASRSPGLNVYVWRGVCSSDVAHLKKSRTFPDYPDEQRIVTEFDVEDNGIDYGQRIFGFFHPEESGLHRFAISSDDTSELWLSPNEDSNEKQLIASVYSKDASAWTSKGDLKKYSHQISNYIELRAGTSYYVEAIHKQGTGLGFVQVYWTNSAPGAEFHIITSKYLSTYSENSTLTARKDVVHALFSLAGRQQHGTTFKNPFFDFYSLPLVTEKTYLPSCVYKSSFVLKNRIYRYNGIQLVYESNVYPLDDTDMGARGNVWSWPNREADKQLVKSVAEDLVTCLRLKTSKNYVLKRILRVVQKPDPVYGDRFSVDLEVVLEDNTNKMYRLSEHVYLPKRSHSLCFPEGINWKYNATVYFILPVKNQGKWVYHFINQLSEASLLTGDTNFHVVVIDFESQDIDMKRAFNTSLLRSRHTVVNLQGKFYKTLALNKGVELVPSPHDIVLLFDLHIDVPADLLNSIRKNTIEGRIAYFPIVGRLDCESTADEHRGFWQMNGYGILGVYKSDWIRFGGMNTKTFQYKWGGEDWDLLDRVINARLEVERVKQAGLFHHFHSKQKKWD